MKIYNLMMCVGIYLIFAIIYCLTIETNSYGEFIFNSVFDAIVYITIIPAIFIIPLLFVYVLLIGEK